MSCADVIIIGGGFAGLSAAAAFVGAGAEVSVLEALDRPLPTFRGELLHPPGVSALRELGLNDALAAAGAVPVRGFSVSDGRSEAVLPYGGSRPLGAGFEHRLFVETLRERLATHSRARLLLRTRIEDLVIERGRVAGVRAGGNEHRAPLLLVADGRHSRTRELLGIDTRTNLLSYMAVAGLSGDVLPRPDYGHVFVGTPGPVLAYPYADRRVRVCLDIPLEAAKGGGGALRAYVGDHYADLLPGPLRRALHASLRSGQLHACANHAVTAETSAVPGAALVGDAGGCSHPLSATGMTTALHDVTTLLECVSKHGLTDDALAEYQQRRYRYVRARELFAQALYEVFRGEDLATRTLRAGVFSYWEKSERARHASLSILTADEPRLAPFLAEYARVTGLSGWQLARGAVAGPRQAVNSLRALCAMVAANARMVRQHAQTNRGLDRSPELTPLCATPTVRLRDGPSETMVNRSREAGATHR